MPKGNTIATLALIGGGLYLVSRASKGENPLQLTIAPLFGGDGGEGGLLGGDTGFGGLFSGLGEGLQGLFGGLGDAIGKITAPLQNLAQLSPIQGFGANPNNTPLNPATGNGGGGGGGGFWDTPLVYPTGNAFVDISNSLGQGLMNVAKAGLVGAGTYAGVKVGVPLAQTTARAIAPAVRAGGSILTNAIRSGGQLTARGLSAGGTALLSPISALSPVLVGTAAVGAFAGGYAGGTWLMQHTKLGPVTNRLAESAGASFARSGIGQSVLGVARVNTAIPSVKLIQQAQAQGLSGNDAIQYARTRLAPIRSGGAGMTGDTYIQGMIQSQVLRPESVNQLTNERYQVHLNLYK